MKNKMEFSVTTEIFGFIGNVLDSVKRNMISQYIMFLNLSIVGIVTVNIFPVFSLTNPKMSTMFNRHKKDWKKIVPSVKRCSEKVLKNALDNIENWLKFSDT